MKIVINKKKILDFIFLFFIIFPSFRFIGFEMNYVGTATPSYIRIWSLLALIVSTFLYVKKLKYQKKDLPVLLYCGYMFLLSFYMMLNNAEVAITSLLSFITAFIGVMYLIRTRGHEVIDLLFTFFSLILLIELLVNFTPLNAPFVNSKTLTFIGHIQIYSMLWVTYVTLGLIKLSFIEKEKNKINFKTIKIIILLIISTILAWSYNTTTATMTITLFIIIFFFFKNKKINNSKWLKTFFIVALILNASFLFFNYQYNFASFWSKIGEDATLNGRTYIWSLFLPLFFKSPFVGYGYKAKGVILSNWGHTNVMDYCHNTLLQELINGGIIQLVLFIIVIFKMIDITKKCDNNKMYHIAFCCLISFFMIMITESVTYYNYLNIIIVILLNLDDIIESYKKYKGEII